MCSRSIIHHCPCHGFGAGRGMAIEQAPTKCYEIREVVPVTIGRWFWSLLSLLFVVRFKQLPVRFTIFI